MECEMTVCSCCSCCSSRVDNGERDGVDNGEGHCVHNGGGRTSRPQEKDIESTTEKDIESTTEKDIESTTEKEDRSDAVGSIWESDDPIFTRLAFDSLWNPRSFFWRPCALTSLVMMHRKSIYHDIRGIKLPLEPFSCHSLLSGVLNTYPLQNYPDFSLHFLIHVL
jgi:hypothetical protein